MPFIAWMSASSGPEKIRVQNYRMTAGGPAPLTTRKLLAQLPLVDSNGCERVTLVDDAVVARVRRSYELKKILATREFGYREVDERFRLEKLKDLDKELTKDAVPALFVPGAQDRDGGREISKKSARGGEREPRCVTLEHELLEPRLSAAAARDRERRIVGELS